MIKKFKLFETLFSENDSDFIKLKEIVEDSLIDLDVTITSALSTDHEYDDPHSRFTAGVTFNLYFKNVTDKISIGNPYGSEVVDYDKLISNVDGYSKVSNSMNSLLHRLKESNYLVNYFATSENSMYYTITISFIIQNEKVLFKDN